MDCRRLGSWERFGAWFYDLAMWPVEWGGARRWRRALWEGVHGRVLEVGIGTGASLLAHPRAVQLVGVDRSAAALARAEAKAARLGLSPRLVRGDLHRLPFAAAEFDWVVGSFVLCSVARPVEALRELRRVLRPEGELRLLEHVRPRHPRLGRLLSLVAPHFAKRTWELFPQAGWEVVEERDLDRLGLIRLYRARARGN
jgi:ubiquinone/menaquinone biosynthesis C-methylase UbiE